MKLVKHKNISGFYIYTEIEVNGNKLTAMVDTGSTSLLVDVNKLKIKNIKACELAGVNGESKAFCGLINVTCNNITKRKEIVLTDFGMINQICIGSGVKTYDAIIGIKEIIQFNLQKKLYDTIRSK